MLRITWSHFLCIFLVSSKNHTTQMNLWIYNLNTFSHDLIPTNVPSITMNFVVIKSQENSRKMQDMHVLYGNRNTRWNWNRDIKHTTYTHTHKCYEQITALAFVCSVWGQSKHERTLSSATFLSLSLSFMRCHHCIQMNEKSTIAPNIP